MMRMLPFWKNHNQYQPKDKPQYCEELDITSTHDDDDSLSMAGSVETTSRRSPHSTYQTHSFQQRFHMQHPPAGEKMEGFTTFMKKAASSLSPPSPHKKQKHASQPLWWSFDKDYDEEKEEHDEEEEVVDFDNAVSPRRETCFEESKESSLDGLYGFHGDATETSHLFAQHNIFKTFMKDLGSNLDHQFLYQDEEEKVEMASDDLDFQPRLQADCLDDDHTSEGDASFEDFSHNNNFDTTFLEDVPVRPPQESSHVEKCFENILLLSPEYFDTLQEATEKEKRQDEAHQEKHNRKNFKAAITRDASPPFSPSLSSMVHSMNPDLFIETPEDKTRASKKSSDVSAVTYDTHDSSNASSTATTESDSAYRIEQYTVAPPKKNRFESIRKKLASSFRSKAGKGRVTYCLSKTNGGMTKKERLNSRSLLPAKPLLTEEEQRLCSTSTRIPRSIPFIRDRPLSILLLNPVLKIFEIVLVDFCKNTTVGDALSKARANATDSNLSEQKYVSLCNKRQELAAPMLQVSLLVDSQRSKKNGLPDSSDSDVSADDYDKINRRAMEARLLVAVPEGSTADVCQTIRRMLWKNPKIQRWWKQNDPFKRPEDSEMETDTIPEPSVAKVKKTRRDKNKKIKYRPL